MVRMGHTLRLIYIKTYILHIQIRGKEKVGEVAGGERRQRQGYGQRQRKKNQNSEKETETKRESQSRNRIVKRKGKANRKERPQHLEASSTSMNTSIRSCTE